MPGPVQGARIPGKVLIVDDEEPLREIVTTRLTFMTDEIRAAPDGEVAWSMIEEDPPDVLITDLMMPRLTGEELCQRVRSSPVGKNIWVLILTARAGAKRRVEGLELGADDYLEKPFDLDEMAARVRTGLRIRALQREVQSVVRNETIGWVAYALGHEIRNPLAVVLANAEVQKEHGMVVASLWKAAAAAAAKLEAAGSTREAQSIRQVGAKLGGMAGVIGEMREIAEANVRLARRSAAAVAALQRFAEGASGTPTSCDPLLLVEDAVRLSFAGSDTAPEVAESKSLPPVRCVPRDVVLALATALARASPAEQRARGVLPTIDVRGTDGWVALRVEGPGDGTPAAGLLTPRIADHAPGEYRSGLDVGLAHAQVALSAAGGSLSVEAGSSGGIVVELRLPVPVP
jgi:DNA-binding response OmpR family regulator